MVAVHPPLSDLVRCDPFGRPAPGVVVMVDVFDYTGTKVASVDGKSLPDVVEYWRERRPGTPIQVRHGEARFYGCTESVAGSPIPESATHAEIWINFGLTLEVQFVVVAS